MNILAEQACFFFLRSIHMFVLCVEPLSVAFVRNKILYFSRAQAYSSLFLHSVSVKYKCSALFFQV